MKLTDLGIVFASVFVCFSVIWGFKIGEVSSISFQNIRYNQAVDNAVTDALHMFVELDDGEELKFNIDEAKEQFFRTLGINMGINSEYERNRLEEYVPMLCFLLPEGFYIYHNLYSENESGQWEREYVVSEFYNYYTQDQYYEYCFTLSDEIWVKDKKTLEVFQGKPSQVAKYCDAKILKDEINLERKRRETIVESVIQKMEHYANEHNLRGKEYGITYEITIPDTSDSTWIRTIDNPGIMALVQGIPYGMDKGYYKRIAFGGARLHKIE